MSRLNKILRDTRGLVACSVIQTVLFCGVAALASDSVPEQKSTEPDLSTLSQIGIDLESARLLPAAEKQSSLQTVVNVLVEVDGQGVPSHQRAAVFMLWGEIHHELGEYSRAVQDYEQATKASDDKALTAAGAFLHIQALETEGEDEEAAKAWRKWLKKYSTSPMVPEAELRLIWNRLRGGNLEEAGDSLGELVQRYPWLTTDPRIRLVQASMDFLRRKPSDALVSLGKDTEGAAATYLRALCHEGNAEILKAAAAYQEVADRYKESPLRDHAMLAKANTFLTSGAFRSASEEFQRVVTEARNNSVQAEAALRHAAAVFLAGDSQTAEPLLRDVVAQYTQTDVAARAQFLLGEVMLSADSYEAAIVEFNRVLTSYFDQAVAASAQYRVGRCLDALGRQSDATSAYQAVVSGYPLEPEAPAAAYLAGVGLMEMEQPQAALPYFQLVLDRYASTENSDGTVVFASPEHQELVEASLCLLELAYHRTGDLGQLSGAPHLLLHKTPPSQSPWRAYALLIDADALAAQGQYEQARHSLEGLFREFPEHPAATAATQLLAWTYAQQGEEELAIETSEQMLARYGQEGDPQLLSSAYLNLAHVRFNQRQYEDAALAYEEFLYRYPDHPQSQLALYQAGLCYMRLDRNGDAIDRWETIVRIDPTAEIAERAWARAGDLYFQAEYYEDAKRCYQGLLEHFAGSSAAALGMLRIAQCYYNAGEDAQALAEFSSVVEHFPSSPMRKEAERGMELALYRLGQQAGGITELTELVQRYPTSAFAADAQFQIAKQLYEEGQYLAAADEFRRVVSQFPGYSAADRAQFLLGDSYAQAGDSNEARQAFEQFLLFFSDSELRTTIRFRLGMIYFENSEYMRAAINFTGVLEQETSQEVASASLYNLALCKRLMANHTEALAEFEQYRQRFPADERAAEVAYQLGDIHDILGNTNMAIAEMERAITAGPPKSILTEICYRLGSCREKLEDHEGAIGAYKKAAASGAKDDPFRLSAVARSAVLYEEKEDYREALAAYRDLIKNAHDPELVAAATGRATELAAVVE